MAESRLRPAHRCPVWIISGDDLILRESEDALLEYQLRVGGTHLELRLASTEEVVDGGPCDVDDPGDVCHVCPSGI